MTEPNNSYDNLQLRREKRVAHITITSSSAQNGITPAFAEEFLDLVISLDEDERIDCLTLTGSGDAFSVGADLTLLEGMADDSTSIRSLATRLHDGVLELHRATTPLVVGVNGVAAGAGFSLALTGDIVLVSEDARMKYAYSQLGLTGDGGSTFYLPRLIGLRRAKEVALLDESITPERAVDLGLATEVVPADLFTERMEDVARTLADGPTKAFGQTKRLLTESFNRGLAEQLKAETTAITNATQTGEYREGYAAFFGDEPPDFTDI